MCAPRCDGGLGFHNMHDFNKALIIMKFGWGLIKFRDDLWVRVFHSKYQCGEGIILNVLHKTNTCCTWQTICKIWGLLMDGLRWKMVML